MAEKTRSMTDDERALLDDGLALLLTELHRSRGSGLPPAVSRTVDRQLDRLDALGSLLGVADRLVVHYDQQALEDARDYANEVVDAEVLPADERSTLLGYEPPPPDDELPGESDDGIDTLGGVE